MYNIQSTRSSYATMYILECAAFRLDVTVLQDTTCVQCMSVPRILHNIIYFYVTAVFALIPMYNAILGYIIMYMNMVKQPDINSLVEVKFNLCDIII